MDKLLSLRETIIDIIKRNENILLFLSKFIVGLVIYIAINSIGFSSSTFSYITESPFSFAYIVFMGLLFAYLPLNVNYFLIILNITLQFSSRIELALVVFLVLLTIFLFYGHFGKKESSLMIATVLGFYFNIPYLIPLFAGLYLGITSILPIVIGIFIWSYADVVLNLMVEAEASSLNLIDISDTTTYLFSSLNYSSINSQITIVFSLIFTIVLVCVYIISKLNINYSKEIAVIIGVLVNILGFLISILFIDINTNLLSVIFFSLVSGLIVLTIRFFDIVLDYNCAEKVEFEDENNYYYVKVIPKVKPRKTKNDQVINPKYDE